MECIICREQNNTHKYCKCSSYFHEECLIEYNKITCPYCSHQLNINKINKFKKQKYIGEKNIDVKLHSYSIHKIFSGLGGLQFSD
jgi:hypothetical protein